MFSAVQLALVTPALALIASVVALLALYRAWSLGRRLEALTLSNTQSLEQSIQTLLTERVDMQQFRVEVESYLKRAEVRLKASVQGVGVVRFNPFSGDGSGGNQSFAVALLDETLSGVVFSSIYARDRVGVYAKPVSKGVSAFELTREEQEALNQAKQSVTR